MRKMKREWTADHTKTLKALVNIGLNNATIAAHTGHHVETVRRRRDALGLPDTYEVRYGSWADLPVSALRAMERETRRMAA